MKDLLNRLRRWLEPVIIHLGRIVSQLKLPPILWTGMGLLFAILSGVAYSGIFIKGIFLGGLLLLLSGLMDILDGAVARAINACSTRGAFLDSTFDRLGEVSVYTGIIVGGYLDAWIVILTLSFSLLVSYVRARGESLGLKLSGMGIGERAERILILALASILGFLSWGVIIVLVLAFITFIHRLQFVVRVLR